MYNCTKCNMNMWSDEILENKTCKHHFPYMDMKEPRCNMCGDLVHDMINGVCYTCSIEVTLIQEPIELSPSDLT